MARIATNELTYVICDLWGAHLADGVITEHIAGTAQIDRLLNDTSTAHVSIDIYHKAGYLVQKPNGPLTRVIKVFFNPTKALHPIYTGVLMEPNWKGEAATLELDAVDAPFRLQRAYLATAYATPPGGKDIGQVMVDLIGRAANRVGYPFGAPGLGISIGAVDATYNVDREWDAGENIWDALEELAQLAGAPDLGFTPLDLTDGTLWQFNAKAPLGTDHTATAIFEYNTGLSNCADMEYAPSGDPVNNWYTAMGQPPDDGSLTNPTGYAKHDGSIAERGVYEGWDSNDATDIAVEQAKAKELVAAYHEPPDYITITPNPERQDYPSMGAPPRIDIDYTLGDTVRAVGRKGSMVVDENGRVNSYTLTEDDETGALSTTLECAPNVDPTGVVTF